MQTNDNSYIIALVSTFALLCCCCVVVIGAGAGAFFFLRRSQKPAAAPPAGGVIIDAASAAASSVPTMTYTAPAPAEPSVMETVVGQPPAAPEAPAPPAGPIEPDDIRAKLLELNSPDKPYMVHATGYKIVVAPVTVTGYLLEISFDYADKVARFVETNPLAADQSIRYDARQVLEATGWTVRE